MKKKLSLMLAFLMIVSLFPVISAEAAYQDNSLSPQAIVEEFENDSFLSKAEFPTGFLGGSSVSWAQTGTHNASQGAVQINPKNKAKMALFPWRVEAGNTYHISAWVKFTKGSSIPDMNFILRGGSSDITIPASKSQAFALNTWVEITATYPATASIKNATIDFRIGSDNMGSGNMFSGSSYALLIDDFIIYPEVQPTTDDVILEDDFAKETNVTSGLWKKPSNGSINWISEGANGTTGAVQITKGSVGSYDELVTNALVPFQFGKRYRLTFWIKAMNEDAVGKSIRHIFAYDQNTVTDPNLVAQKLWAPEMFSDLTLTNDWQKIVFDNIKWTSSSIEETFPDFRIRIGGGTENGLSYAVDEIKLERYDGENIDVVAKGHYSADTPDGIVYQFAVEGSLKTFLYRLYQETASGDVLLAHGQTKEGYLSFARNGLPADLSSLRLDVIAVNAYGTCSEVVSCYLEETEENESMSISCDQYIWNNDVKTLSATVRYLNDSNPDSITAYVAQYDNEKRLLGVTPASKTVSAREDSSWTVSASVFPTATKAKFFAWYENSVTPVTYSCEIDKTTSGAFIYVDANCASNGDGSFAAPFKTISAAKEYLKTFKTQSAEKNFYVVLKGGEYTNDYETLRFTAADGIADGKMIIYTSLNSDRAKITGAKHIAGSNFTLHDASKNIYKVSVPAGTQTRQLYVNGIKATRARSAEDAIPFVNEDRHDPSYKPDNSLSMPLYNEPFNNLGITTTDLSFLNYAHIEDLELYFAGQWRHQFIRPDEVVADGDVARLKFTDEAQISEWRWLNRDNAPVREVIYAENAYELLDEPGEWYLDTHVSPHVLYYKPRSFETISTADFVIPAITKLMTLAGAYDAQFKNTVNNIAFKNIDFEYTGWNRPSEIRGFRNGQNATFEDVSQNTETKTLTNNSFDADRYSNGGGSLMVGAVEVKHVKNITFDNCDFSKIGSMALKMIGAVQNCNVLGNEFYEIAGSAITLGEVGSVDGKSATGIVGYLDSPTNTVPSGYMSDLYTVNNTLVANNYIHKVATEYREAAAIGAGYPVHTTIRNNDISDGSYCGIHTGWGWSSSQRMTAGFVMEKNFIHNFMNWRLYDGAAIYMLGGTNGDGTYRTDGKDSRNMVRENYFQDVQNLYGGVYPDEGSNNWWIEENVIDMSNYPIMYGTEDYLMGNRWIHIHSSSISDIHTDNNYSTTGMHQNAGTRITYEAPTVVPDANWPGAAQQIINAAGIEKQYLNRFAFDLQMIRMAPMVEVAAGKTENLVYEGVASKDRRIDLSDYEITVKSSNPQVATATRTSVTGKTAGTAWITMEIVRKDASGKVQYFDEHVFRVVVK